MSKLNKLTKLYNVFAACFDGAFQRVVCAMRSLGSMPCECINHAHPHGEHTRLSAYGQYSKRDRRKPRMSRAFINQNAACLSHAAKRLSVAKSPATRPSFQKAHAKRVERLTMCACNCSTCCVDVILISEDMWRLGCSDCLFVYYCNDKDKICLSVSNPYDFYCDNLDFQTDIL